MNEVRLTNIIMMKLTEEKVKIAWEPMDLEAFKGSNENKLSVVELNNLCKTKIVQDDKYKDIEECSYADILNIKSTMTKIMQTFVFTVQNIEKLKGIIDKIDEVLINIYKKVEEIKKEYSELSDPLGKTLVLDYIIDNNDKSIYIDSYDMIDSILVEYFEKIEPENMQHKIVKKSYHNYDEHGLTISYILSESSLVYHSYSDKQAISFDFYSCKNDYDFSKFVEYITNKIKVKQMLLNYMFDR